MFITQTYPIKFPLGTEVCIGNNQFTIGSEKAYEKQIVVVIPRKTLYTKPNDSTCIPQKLPKDMEFVLETGNVLLDKGTVLYHGKTRMELMDECIATLYL